MTSDRKTVRVRIEGRVQGVGFRMWVERTALQRGLDGWVRNRRDGGVEAVLSGPAAAVDGMVAQCHHGPSAAVVGMVRVLDEQDVVQQGFRIMPTA
jgi:acylphosphatase